MGGGMKNLDASGSYDTADTSAARGSTAAAGRRCSWMHVCCAAWMPHVRAMHVDPNEADGFTPCLRVPRRCLYPYRYAPSLLNITWPQFDL